MKKFTLSKMKEQDREARKNMILDAAVELFSIKPYDTVSMQEIANEAGLAKSSIYTYFPTQEALFVEAAMRASDSLLLKLEGVIDKKGKSDLGEIVNAWIDFFYSHESLFRMSSQFMLSGNISSESIDKLNPIFRRLLDILENTIRCLQYKKDARLLAHTLFSALSGLLISYSNYPGRSKEEIRSHMKKIGENIKDIIEFYIKQNSVK